MRAEHQAGQASSFRQGPKEVVRLESSPADAERVLRMDREDEMTISSTRNREKVSIDSLSPPADPQDSPVQKVDTAGALGQQKGRPKTGSNGRPDDVPDDSEVNSECTGVARSTTELLGHVLLMVGSININIYTIQNTDSIQTRKNLVCFDRTRFSQRSCS